LRDGRGDTGVECVLCESKYVFVSGTDATLRSAVGEDRLLFNNTLFLNFFSGWYEGAGEGNDIFNK
jgi:hypothetical protein